MLTSQTIIESDTPINNMRLLPIIALAPLLVAAMPGANPEAREASDLTKRACSNVGCECRDGAAGVYCGMCYGVLSLGSGSTHDVYQCNGNGGCCDYGYADDCDFSPTRCG